MSSSKAHGLENQSKLQATRPGSLIAHVEAAHMLVLCSFIMQLDLLLHHAAENSNDRHQEQACKLSRA